jgi:sortase A
MRLRLGIFLALLGLACLAWVGTEYVQQAQFQREQAQKLEQALNAPKPAPPAPAPKRERLARQALVGRLEIPRVKLSAIVAEGDDDATLKKAIGHLPDTVLPWESGNSGLAAHRDTFFRPLRHVKIGDEVRLTSPRGVFTYRVSDTFITTPTDVGILKPHGRDELTLVTCYPFDFVGDAPQRYIVRAERVSLAPPAEVATAAAPGMR